MKKKIFIGIFAAVVLGFSALGMLSSVNQDAEVSQITLDNVEALAQYEGGGSSGSWYCWSRSKWWGSGHWRCGSPCVYIDGRGGKNPIGTCVAY